MWDKYFEDNDTDSDLDDPQPSNFSTEKNLQGNHYPLTVRKHREFVAPDDVVARVYPKEGETEFDWYTPEEHDKETYFAMVNFDRRTVEEGE